MNLTSHPSLPRILPDVACVPRRRLLSCLAVLVVALAAGVAGLSAPAAEAKVTVGIGQQNPEMFANPLWRALKAPYARYITPWDTISDPPQLARLDIWMASARAAGAHPMIGFRGSLKNARAARRLPTPKQFAAAFRALRARYPTVSEWIPWNETNHPTALTGSRPKLAAEYYNAVVRACRGCNVVGGDVLDIGNMESWLRRYQRYTHPKPRIWGLHNYGDANRLTSTGVRRLLKVVRGQVWMTETGGVVRLRIKSSKGMHRRTYGVRKAARATRYVLDLARISPRISRIYLYHWSAPRVFTSWDSGLLDSHLRPRPAYKTLVAWLKSARRRGLAR